MTENVEAQKRSEAELREARKHTDDHLNALITIVDNLIRNPPPRPQ